MRVHDLAEGQALRFDGLLSPEACAEWIRRAEDVGFAPAPAGNLGRVAAIRDNERVVLPNTPLPASMWSTVSAHLPMVDGLRPTAFSTRIRVYRYLPGQRFMPHIDGVVHERGMESRFSMLIYLNDVDGGATEFTTFQVMPRTGCGLAFRHHLRHRARRFAAGRKYVLRTDVLFSSPG